MKNVARALARSSASEVAITNVRLPRKIAPPPAPATIAAVRNKARLGGDVQAEATSTPSPMIVGAIPAAIRRCAGQLVVVVWATTPAPKVRKIVKPHNAGDGWRSGPARNVPASPANSPKTAKSRN